MFKIATGRMHSKTSALVSKSHSLRGRIISSPAGRTLLHWKSVSERMRQDRLENMYQSQSKVEGKCFSEIEIMCELKVFGEVQRSNVPSQVMLVKFLRATSMMRPQFTKCLQCSVFCPSTRSVSDRTTRPDWGLCAVQFPLIVSLF